MKLDMAISYFLKTPRIERSDMKIQCFWPGPKSALAESISLAIFDFFCVALHEDLLVRE